ncbi:hypothetical protein N7447_005171 [Penicillium robsamsonii]|uniref:uncharacterized protein n=1 Tax=Penicillium robsamsonii TaxID=1792511 RepID=UPI002547B8F4|nr:uncharacterized protein N7447_005171 [Penicillium robsamsonii]KAJ5822831.1 hypothetical protein N7447_005171 [Penicillium robsamsonii]
MASLYTETTPAVVKNAKGLHLITCLTPNGKKVQILLEELKDIYGLEWTTSLIDIDTDEQKKPWFLKLNPNGKIPVLIDNTGEQPFPVLESSAELLYLIETTDKDHQLSFSNVKEQSQMMQWLIFWHASGQPNQSQLNHFGRFAPEQIPYAIEKFKTETLRIYNVLEIHLSGRLTCQAREYLAGNGLGKFSIADIDAYPWVQAWKRSKISEEEMASYPHLKEWINRIGSRPAVQRGVSDFYDEAIHPELLIST